MSRVRTALVYGRAERLTAPFRRCPARAVAEGRGQLMPTEDSDIVTNVAVSGTVAGAVLRSHHFCPCPARGIQNQTAS